MKAKVTTKPPTKRELHQHQFARVVKDCSTTELEHRIVENGRQLANEQKTQRELKDETARIAKKHAQSVEDAARMQSEFDVLSNLIDSRR